MTTPERDTPLQRARKVVLLMMSLSAGGVWIVSYALDALVDFQIDRKFWMVVVFLYTFAVHYWEKQIEHFRSNDGVDHRG